MPPAASTGIKASDRHIEKLFQTSRDVEAEYEATRDAVVHRETLAQFKSRKRREAVIDVIHQGGGSAIVVLALWIPLFSVAFSRVEGWRAWDAYIFTGTVVSTIGYGNISPSTTAGKWLVVVCGFFGIPAVLHALSFIGILTRAASNATLKRIKKQLGLGETTDARDEIVFCTFLIVVYFVHCVVVYWLMEDWSLTTSTYYSFSTFSTIGLGDYVPLTSTRQRNVWKHCSWYHAWHLAAVVLGMALISLLFTLIHERALIAERAFRLAKDKAELRRLRRGLALKRKEELHLGDADPVLVTTRKLLAAAYCQCGENWHLFFEQMDADHNGHIERAELLDAFRNTLHADHVSDAQIDEIFSAVDTKKSGFIDPEELIALMDCAQLDDLDARKHGRGHSKTRLASSDGADDEAKAPEEARFAKARDSLTLPRRPAAARAAAAPPRPRGYFRWWRAPRPKVAPEMAI